MSDCTKSNVITCTCTVKNELARQEVTILDLYIFSFGQTAITDKVVRVT